MKAKDQCLVYSELIKAWRSQFWTADRINAYQASSLVDMMRHALTSVPYYRRLGIDLSTIRGSDDLQRFPILTKRDIQIAGTDLRSESLDPDRHFTSRTSGSTGEPTTTFFDHKSWLYCKYVLKMRRMAATGGIGPRHRVLIISEQPVEELEAVNEAAPSGLGIFFCKRMLSIHSPVEEHLIELSRFKPHVLYAYPSYLLELIAVAERKTLTLPSVKIIYTSSEILTQGARRHIETSFGGRLHDIYGSTEMKEVAWQCKSGSYHLNFESTFVETPAKDARGPLILTTLLNTGMPLIRFAIGDEATIAGDSCNCGRNSPCLEQIDGRQGDFITLPDGRRLSPYLLTTVVETDPDILQYQIVQTTPTAFRVDLIRRPRNTSSRRDDSLCKELETLTGNASFTVNEVQTIKRKPSGKRSVFVRLEDSA